MRDEAVAWAESILGEAVVEVTELSGGLTSTMLALSQPSGASSVLRLMTNEPWRTHGADLTRRERAAQVELVATPVPTPVSLGLDPEGATTGVAAHLMSRLPGAPTAHVVDTTLAAMAEMLAVIYDVHPTETVPRISIVGMGGEMGRSDLDSPPRRVGAFLRHPL